MQSVAHARFSWPNIPYRHSRVKSQTVTRCQGHCLLQRLFHSHQLLHCLLLYLRIIPINSFNRSLQDKSLVTVKRLEIRKPWQRRVGCNGLFVGSLWHLQDSMNKERRVLIVEFVSFEDILGDITE